MDAAKLVKYKTVIFRHNLGCHMRGVRWGHVWQLSLFKREFGPLCWKFKNFRKLGTMPRTEDSGFEFVEHEEIRRVCKAGGEFLAEIWGLDGEIEDGKNSMLEQNFGRAGFSFHFAQDSGRKSIFPVSFLTLYPP